MRLSFKVGLYWLGIAKGPRQPRRSGQIHLAAELLVHDQGRRMLRYVLSDRRDRAS